MQRTIRAALPLLLLAAGLGFLICGYLPWATVAQAPGQLVIDGRLYDYRGGAITLTGWDMVGAGLMTHGGICALGAVAWSRRWWAPMLGLVVLYATYGLSVPAPPTSLGVELTGIGSGLVVARVLVPVGFVLLVACTIQAAGRAVISHRKARTEMVPSIETRIRRAPSGSRLDREALAGFLPASASEPTETRTR
jgi:hypothetical protein